MEGRRQGGVTVVQPDYLTGSRDPILGTSADFPRQELMTEEREKDKGSQCDPTTPGEFSF